VFHFENSVLRRIFGPKWYELTREWKKLHNEEEMGGTCSADGVERGVCRVLVGKPEGKRPLERSKHRWEGNIRLDLHEVGCGYGLGWAGSG
jgi:hypothetical protein